MNYRILLFTVLMLLIAVASYKATYAFFTSNQIIAGNTITTAFISPTPTTTPTPTITITPTITPSPTPISIADHIVISEIQIKGSGTQSNSKDFIELYNPTSSPINLNGHRLVKRATPSTSDTNIFVFSSSNSVPAHGFFLWANSDNGFSASIFADVSSTDNISTNDSVALRNGSLDTGAIIDALAWGSTHASPLIEGSAFPTNPNNSDESLERKALSTSDATSMTSGSDVAKGNGFDSNNNSTDFILRTTSDPQNSSSSTESP